MKLRITTRHFKAPQPLIDSVVNQILRFEKYGPISSGNVILSWQKQTHIATVILKLRGQNFIATKKSDSFRKSISCAIEKLEHRFRKQKEINRRRSRRIKAKKIEIERSITEVVTTKTTSFSRSKKGSAFYKNRDQAKRRKHDQTKRKQSKKKNFKRIRTKPSHWAGLFRKPQLKRVQP